MRRLRQFETRIVGRRYRVGLYVPEKFYAEIAAADTRRMREDLLHSNIHTIVEELNADHP